MLYTNLLRRAIAVHLTSSSFRGFSTSPPFAAAMALSPRSYSLNRSIFNETLYSRMRDFWFADVPDDVRSPTFDMAKRWFGVGQTEEQNKAFDNECYANFGHALEALAPQKLALPPFEGYEQDIENAAALSAPLLAEVQDAQGRDHEKGAKTLLSLLLLLDQMPRNIYREPAGLRLVYQHYDRLAFTLLRGSMQLQPCPLDHDSVNSRPVYESWLLLPLMHSEHLPSHDLSMEYNKRTRDEMVKLGDQAGVEAVDRAIDFEMKHQEPLKLFGRYPHRNEALGRPNTKEEEEYLKNAETFGVKQRKDSEPATDKSEL